jgi:hypothetical protein
MQREPRRRTRGPVRRAPRAPRMPACRRKPLTVRPALLACGLLALLAAPLAQAQEAAKGGVSAAELAKANNPLADANAINFQNYFMPSLQGLPDASVDLFLLRPVMVAGRQIIRGTIPFQTSPTGLLSYDSGIGDINVFDAILLTGPEAKTMIGVGPLLVMPTASSDALGAGKWQAGAAAVVVRPLAGGSMLAGLVTWQTDFAGDADRAGTDFLTAQPVAILQIGAGFYVRSTGLMTFDLENEKYLVPFGVGIGKVFKVGRTVVNGFLEPQFSVYAKGEAQPQWQVFAGINLQWFKAKK